MNKRAVFLLAGIGFIALFVAIWLMVRVERTLAPAPDDASPVQQNTEGVPKLKQESLITGLSNVWDVGFLPDKTLLFTERAGTISKLTNGKKTILLQVPNVIAQGEGGLMGLVMDPDFSKNHYIYACYNTPQDIRISRWQMNDGATKLTNQKDIVTGLPIVPDSGRHSGCRPRFGADGYLWIGTGDVAKGTNPQDPKSLGGKVLRVDREGKAAASGNLASPFDPRIYNYGHRNVQGMAMFDKPQDGVYGYSVEHGPDREDEVNLLVPGNMGWDPIPGYNESVPMTDKAKYPDAQEAVWRSGDGTIAPSGATIIKGNKWLSLSGRLAIAVLKNQHVRLLEFDNISTLKSEEVLFEGEYGRIRSVVMGPSDDMYITTDNGDGQDQIIRISVDQ
jgi:glucose/arabinose dehydrogenase